MRGLAPALHNPPPPIEFKKTEEKRSSPRKCGYNTRIFSIKRRIFNDFIFLLIEKC